jgi:hypothetical protein
MVASLLPGFFAEKRFSKIKWNLSFEFHKVKGFNVVYIKRVERKEELHEKEDLN